MNKYLYNMNICKKVLYIRKIFYCKIVGFDFYFK